MKSKMFGLLGCVITVVLAAIAVNIHNVMELGVIHLLPLAVLGSFWGLIVGVPALLVGRPVLAGSIASSILYMAVGLAINPIFIPGLLALGTAVAVGAVGGLAFKYVAGFE